MVTVLLTGVSGFIGFHIAKKLLEENIRVIAPVRKQSIEKTVILQKYNNFKFIEGDFYNTDILKQISDPIDIILHFASIRGEGAGDEKEYQQINVYGTENLLKFASESKIRKFIYCSSVGVLGSIPQNQPAGADQKVNPDNFYHNSKWQAEQLVLKYHNANLETCILRPTITYGGGDNGFIPRMVQLVKTKRFPLSSKKVCIHLLDVSAFSNLILKTINRGHLNGKIYIVADKSPVLLKDVVKEIASFLGNNSGWIKVPHIILSSGEFFLKILNQKKLLTSVQLINQNWTYKIDETISDLQYHPSDTLTGIKNYLKETPVN